MIGLKSGAVVYDIIAAYGYQSALYHSYRTQEKAKFLSKEKLN